MIIIAFDDPGILAAAKRDPNGFVAGLQTPVTLDEVQHVPELFPSIKAAIDRKRQPGRFLLTGSANVMLPQLSESLAGLMEILTLWPCSQGELRGAKQTFLDTLFSRKPVSWIGKPALLRRAEMFESMAAGGYPPVVGHRSSARRDAWLGSYVTNMLQRDTRDLANVADATAVPQLLSVVAARAGGRLNFADLSARSLCPETLFCPARNHVPAATASSRV